MQILWMRSGAWEKDDMFFAIPLCKKVLQKTIILVATSIQKMWMGLMCIGMAVTFFILIISRFGNM